MLFTIINQIDASVGHSHISENSFNQIAFLTHTQVSGSFHFEAE